MPTSAPVNSFDYNALDLDTASFVRQQTGEIRALMRRATQEIFEIGQKLIEIKQKLGHGNFLDWLEAEFSWTERTARRFMSVAEQFADKSDTMTELDFAPTALYTLASPSLSSEAREEAIERAKAGEFISAKKAEEIKQKYQFKTAKAKKTSKVTDTPPRVNPSIEIIDAELEEGRGQKAESRRDNRFVNPSVQSPDEAIQPNLPTDTADKRLLPPALDQEPSSWWRLSRKKPTHLLFFGHPDCEEFRNIIPSCAGMWLSFAPHPDVQIFPTQKIQANMSLTFSTNSIDLNLKIVREAFKTLIAEASYEDDLTAIITQLHDAPLLDLLDRIGITCTIAEPDETQCETILSVWEQLGGAVEQLSKPFLSA